MRFLQNKKKQAGVSLLGVLFWGVFIGAGVLLGFKVFPGYSEFMEVKRALSRTAEKGGQPNDLRDSFDKNVQAGYIKTISAKDLIIEPVGQNFRLSVSYQYKVPLIANATLILDFNSSAQTGS
ncbi:DUF4845 domain-containing protein [Leeia sp. TBRC 13508]|uniref:DUF4845 domain-containing protein n=1 Tax=Leeia speluncae TaxID=2884804 RepID=A0ABS8D231_9NEIS|nr:DUF4845 domain-containing protein [Leeia speluncae]MCB6182252.1 DUF4845 domain-containing protein [Leeia speluncae]